MMRKLLTLALILLSSFAWANEATTTPATTQPVANPIKVGWLVSQSTFDQPIGHGKDKFDSVTAIHQRFVDPEIDFYAIIEPGTENSEDVAKIVTDNFPTDHVISGTDVATLSTLNVIVCSRDWAVKDEVLESIEKAVESGVGLLRHIPLRAASAEQTDIADKLQCVTNSEYYHERAITDCRVVADHPLIADLTQALGDERKLTMSSPNGMKGIVHGTPLIVFEDDVAQIGNLDSNGNPIAGKEPTAPTDSKIFAPLFVSQIGKGKVVACQWDSLPKAISDASQLRFYIHCCQWLAGRPIH